MPSCRVFHAESIVDRFGRCRLCTVALAASKAGVHYGAYMALAGYHDDFRPVAGEKGGEKCAWCGKLFFPRDRRQKILRIRLLPPKLFGEGAGEEQEKT